MDIENTLYAAIIHECEAMERKGAYQGNGHHLAQRLARMGTEALKAARKREESSKTVDAYLDDGEIGNE